MYGNGRGAKLLALVLEDKNKPSSTAEANNINDLEPFVTYNFEVTNTNENDQKVDEQPYYFVQEVEDDLSAVQVLPLESSRTSPSFIENQTINNTLHTDTNDILLSYEVQTKSDDLVSYF